MIEEIETFNPDPPEIKDAIFQGYTDRGTERDTDDSGSSEHEFAHPLIPKIKTTRTKTPKNKKSKPRIVIDQSFVESEEDTSPHPYRTRSTKKINKKSRNEKNTLDAVQINENDDIVEYEPNDPEERQLLMSARINTCLKVNVSEINDVKNQIMDQYCILFGLVNNEPNMEHHLHQNVESLDNIPIPGFQLNISGWLTIYRPNMLITNDVSLSYPLKLFLNVSLF